MKNFKKQYRNIEQRVIYELRCKVENSKYFSKHLPSCYKAIEVNLFNYIELAIVNNKLTFIDNDGYHYSLFCDVTLEDLIDILNVN